MKILPNSILAIALAAMFASGAVNAQSELPAIEGRDDPTTVNGYVGAALDEVAMLQRMMISYDASAQQLQAFDKSSVRIYTRGRMMQNGDGRPLSRIVSASNIAEHVFARRDDVLGVFYARRGHLCHARASSASDEGVEELPSVEYVAHPRTTADDAAKYCREYPDWESARRVTSSSLDAMREITGSTIGNTSR